MKYAVLLVALITACSSSSPGTATSTASPARVQASTSASPPPSVSPGSSFAVLVKNFSDTSSTYTVSLVAVDGHVDASASPRKRSRFVQIGNLSTSLTTLYYLDGDADIHYLRPDGSTGLATSVSLAANQVAAFAVSPDDRRIAVSVLDFTTYPVGTRLYVEDLSGHTNHVEIFAASNVEEWPAGWHGGRLVMALGQNIPPQNYYEGFLRGHGYHVADAQTGNRLLSICDGGDGLFPESAGGIVCEKFPSISVVTWDGATRPAPMVGSCPAAGPISPAGIIASNQASVGGGCSGGHIASFFAADGTPEPGLSAGDGVLAQGWIDDDHLFVVPNPNFAPTVAGLRIANVRTGSRVEVQADGFFAAALPGGL